MCRTPVRGQAGNGFQEAFGLFFAPILDFLHYSPARQRCKAATGVAFSHILPPAAYDARMDSGDLTSDQPAKMRDAICPYVAYLRKLWLRMEQRGFPAQDNCSALRIALTKRPARSGSRFKT